MDATTQADVYMNSDSILFKSATVTVSGSETINDIPCWKITAIPDKSQLAAFLLEQGQIGAISDLGNLDQSLGNISIAAWVAKDSGIVAREVIKLTMLVQGVSVDLSFDASVMNINQPVSIVLPADTANAIVK